MACRAVIQPLVGRPSSGSDASLRVLLLPGPAVAADVLKSALRAPAQAPIGFAGIGDADGGIARPTVGHRVGDLSSAAGSHCLYNLQDGLSTAAAQGRGEEELRCFRLPAVQGGMVAFCEFNHVDVVTPARPFGGGPVASEHLEI